MTYLSLDDVLASGLAGALILALGLAVLGDLVGFAWAGWAALGLASAALLSIAAVGIVVILFWGFGLLR